MARTSRAGTPARSRKRKERPMLEMRFPSDTRYLHMVREVARRFAESTGFDSAEAQGIALAVDEATTNVIQHAYHGRTEREIEIHFNPEGDRLAIQILHDGEPIDQTPLPEFNLKSLVARRRKGGLGIYIMKQVMDRVDYGKAGSGKNVCLMVRYKGRKRK